MHRLEMNCWESHAECIAEALHLHTDSIKLVFCECSRMSIFEGSFVLRCFQHLPRGA